MYPTLYHAALDLFGLDLPVLKFLNSFGFFVALAFLCAYSTLASELRRKTREGLLQPALRTITVGAPATPAELTYQAIIGFVLGFKLLHMVFNMSAVTADPPGFLLSAQGNFFGGVAGAALFTWLLWREKEKEKKTPPEKKTVQVPAVQHAGNITMTAALWGFIGAKLFHWLESPSDFFYLLRTGDVSGLVSGLTMYGGLIVAGIMVVRYFKKNNLSVLPSMDSAAPGLMLAYGVGRIGCHVSGDGDWGVANTKPAPSWLPEWLWSYDYPNNVNSVLGPQRGGYSGVPMTEGPIFEGYGTHLVPGVFPTPLYEMLMCLLLFGTLWFLRKRIAVPGMLFSIYLIMNGVERFLIEKIRVNVPFLGELTQAEVISATLVVLGIVGVFLSRKNAKHGTGPAAANG